MVEAYILIQATTGASQQVASQLTRVSGVVKAHAVMGPYDVIAFVRVANADEMGDLIVDQMHSLPGISRTLTCSVVPINAIPDSTQR